MSEEVEGQLSFDYQDIPASAKEEEFYEQMRQAGFEEVPEDFDDGLSELGDDA